EAGAAARGRPDGVALQLQDVPKRLARSRLVVDDEDVTSFTHAALSARGPSDRWCDAGGCSPGSRPPSARFPPARRVDSATNGGELRNPRRDRHSKGTASARRPSRASATTSPDGVTCVRSASSRFISSGLGRTARAAARRASSARSSCANAVIMITASCGASAFIVFKASTPLRPGIRTSMRTRSGQVWVTTPTAATAELAVVTAYPKADRMSASVSAIPESSSTTKTDRTATTSAGRLGHGEPHLEAAAAPLGALDRHHAAVGVDEHLGHRQPQPDPLGLRRKQRLEDLLHVLG